MDVIVACRVAGGLEKIKYLYDAYDSRHGRRWLYWFASL